MPSKPSTSHSRPNAHSVLAACLVATWLVEAGISSAARADTTGPKVMVPIVDALVDDDSLVLHVRKKAQHRHAGSRLHRLARHDRLPPIERPALAGVDLLQPLPRPAEPPHIVVPLPAYGLDALATLVTTPPPPVVCHPARRDPTLPDPRLYRERTVVCEADNP